VGLRCPLNCLSQRVLHLLLDRLARDAMPGLKPEGDVGVAVQPAGQRFDEVLMSFTVTQKNLL
jgi:hypothetical protein